MKDYYGIAEAYLDEAEEIEEKAGTQRAASRLEAAHVNATLALAQEVHQLREQLTPGVEVYENGSPSPARLQP